jgi:glycosyltransferase involved in cell wall biosynthesis
MTRTDMAVAGNADAAQILRERGFAGPVAVIPQLGMDGEPNSMEAVARTRAELGLTQFTIGYAGRFVREKGLLTLVDALAGLRHLEWQLLLVGDGPIRSTLVKHAARQKILDRLCLVRPVPNAETPRYLSCMDLFVMPSESTKSWREQFGHALIEAMACQVPVIGSTCGEIPNVIGESGCIFREGDSAELGSMLQGLIMNPERIGAMSRAGSARVKSLFTNEAIGKRYLEVYQSAASRVRA